MASFTIKHVAGNGLTQYLAADSVTHCMDGDTPAGHVRFDIGEATGVITHGTVYVIAANGKTIDRIMLPSVSAQEPAVA